MLAGGGLLRAQSIYGTITGTVYDPSGAVVASANVLLKSAATGEVRKGVTNSDGYYSFSSVPVGTYTITVEATGFKKSVAEGIQIAGAASVPVPFKLEIGTASTEVQVTSQADQIIPTDTGEKSFVLTQKQLQDFIIVGSNAAEFIKILPGFVARNGADPMQTGTNYTGQIMGINGGGDAGSQSPLSGAYVANGNQASGGIDITADGAHVSDPGCNCATPVNPNTDMIQEFKVLTSNFNAENTKGPIVINTVAKQGGQAFHGEAYMQARNYNLNSNTWLNNFTKTPRSPQTFYYPGGNIGGPVLIPGTNFNKKRDKLFFFSGFEYYFQTIDTGLLGASVPTMGMRNGDFSPAELAKLGPITPSNGPPSGINSCLTISPTPSTKDNNGNYVCGAGGNGGDPTKPASFYGGAIQVFPGSPSYNHNNVPTPGAPFPGGMIPKGLMDPTGQALMNLYPLPNNDPTKNGGFNYTSDNTFSQNEFQWLTRVDYSISDNTKLYVRYNLQKELQQFPVSLWWRTGDIVPYPTPVQSPNKSESVSASLTHVFNPSLSNEFVFGYTYIDFPNHFKDPSKVSRKALGIPFTGIYHNGVDTIPSMLSWGTANEFASIFNDGGFETSKRGIVSDKWLPSFSDTVSKVWGTHTVKFGFYYENTRNNQPDNQEAEGYVVQYSNCGWCGGSSNPYADLLTGMVDQYQEVNFNPQYDIAYNTIEEFVQDSWKVTKRVTLDYGMRFSHIGQWYDRNGTGYAIWNPAFYNTTTPTSQYPGFEWHQKERGIPVSGYRSRALYYGPRFGLAYDIFGTGKTVFRGGWGQFYYPNAQFTAGLGAPKGEQRLGVNAATFTQIMNTNVSQGLFSSQGLAMGDDKQPHVQSYSATISQKLPFASLLEISYVGNQGLSLTNVNGPGTNVNTLPLGRMFTVGFDPSKQNSNGNPSATSFGPFPTYGTINVANHNYYSNYNGLQVSWVRQKGRYDIAANYTWSKAMGIVGGDALNLRNDYGALPFDRRHIFHAAYSVQLPDPVHTNAFAKAAVNGWQISGITVLQSGVNLTGTSLSQQSFSLFNLAGNTNGAASVNNGFPNSQISNYSINGTPDVPLEPLIVCDPTKNLKPHQFLNGACFQAPTQPGVNGPIVAPEWFGPWFVNTDLSLFKNFQFNESKKLQLRFSGYNFLNHPVWSFSNSAIGSGALNLALASGGTTTSNNTFGFTPIKVGQRIVEFTVKFFF
jgi:hypothetical protein